MHEASYYEKLDEEKVQCKLCPHNCTISDGRTGSCGVRKNKEGTLYSLVYGLPCSLAVDPIEKKPLYHFYPGGRIFSIATVGCNLFCKWCQNHEISHPEQQIIAPYGEISPEKVISLCKEANCSMIAFTYTEPTIFYEYMLAIAKLAKKEKIKTVMVSNGYIEEEPLEELLPYIDAANIDLKSFNEKTYKEWTKATLEKIKKTLVMIKESKTHLEITTLVIPDVNDNLEEVEKMYSWIATTLGKEQVVHISRFSPDYKVLDKERTPLETLEKIKKIATTHLDYVYVGNIGMIEDTLCPSCGKVVIRRGVRSAVALQTCTCGNNISGIIL